MEQNTVPHYGRHHVTIQKRGVRSATFRNPNCTVSLAPARLYSAILVFSLTLRADSYITPRVRLMSWTIRNRLVFLDWKNLLKAFKRFSTQKKISNLFFFINGQKWAGVNVVRRNNWKSHLGGPCGIVATAQASAQTVNITIATLPLQWQTPQF